MILLSNGNRGKADREKKNIHKWKGKRCAQHMTNMYGTFVFVEWNIVKSKFEMEMKSKRLSRIYIK